MLPLLLLLLRPTPCQGWQLGGQKWCLLWMAV